MHDVLGLVQSTMRRKRRKATSVVVDGIVHAIGDTKRASALEDHATPLVSLARSWDGQPWGEFGEYPLRRTTRAQRRDDKARRLRAQIDPMIRLACETRVWRWHNAPRTHAAVTCMTCLVAVSKAGR